MTCNDAAGSSSSEAVEEVAAVDEAVDDEAVDVPDEFGVNIAGFPTLQVLEARRNAMVGGGDCTTTWHARLRYSSPAAVGSSAESDIRSIEFIVGGSELNSERHDREDHSVKAQLSTGEVLTLYEYSHYEKYSNMRNGPGNAKDTSDANRTKLAAYLSALEGIDATSTGTAGQRPDGSSYSSASVLEFAREIDRRAMAGSLPGTVKQVERGPDPDEGRYDNCAPS